MDNSISENEILYTAKNHKYPVYIMIVLFVISLVGAILMTIFWFHMEYKIGFFAFVFMFATVSYRNFFFWINFFTDKLFITSDGILMKQNKEFKKIKFEEIQFVKQENRAESTNFKTYTIIKLKNSEEIFCMNIANFKEFIEEIKKIYPSFDSEDCFKEDIDEEVKMVKSSLFALATLLVCFGLRQFGLYFFLNKVFWIICTPIVILLVIFVVIPMHKKLNKKENK